MADAKLSALTALTTPAVGDLLYAVDIDDTTDDAAGSSKKITLETLLGLKPVQVQSSINGTYASGTTVMPLDNTTPQNTEGTEFYSVAITPKRADSKLLIFGSLILYPSTSINASAALFQDSIADAICGANPAYLGGGTWSKLTVLHLMTAGGVSAITFKLRAGPASAATVYVNGNNSSGLFNGRMASGLVVLELPA